MKGASIHGICFILSLMLMAGCANIVPPGGGPKDETPPGLVSISPADSQLRTRVSEIILQFDEYIELKDAATQVQISPLLPIPLTVTGLNKRVKVVIPDSLLLEETTYRISFGSAIQDIHEGNAYKAKGYTFSTGDYFDSLSLAGTVYDARTGLPDTSALVMLYSADESDSAIVRHKPMYVVHADPSGNFLLQGLPPRMFRLYALRDANGNLTYDGGSEWIAFIDSAIRPTAGTTADLRLRTFPESMGNTTSDSGSNSREPAVSAFSRGRTVSSKDIAAGAYRVGVDTGEVTKRTQEITEPITILLSRRLSGTMNPSRIFLSLDSAGTTIEMPLHITRDMTGLLYRLATEWREDAVYTLRLQKGFAADSSGADLLPGRYIFRTKRDEDYGKLRVHLPSKYYGRSHILQVVNERDTVYQQPVTDTMVNLLRIQPGMYTMRIIEDVNENGRWDAGDLFLRRQPEVVVPYNNIITLKPGWEQEIDFETPVGRKPDGRSLTR